MTRILSPRRRLAFPSLTYEALPPVLRGLAAYGVAEVSSRAVRLVSILVVARQISPATLGAAALALSLFELVRVLGNVGIGPRLIAASDDELPGLLRTASRLFWFVCLAVATIQLAVAATLYVFWEQQSAAAMLAVLSLVYAFMPPGLPSIYLAMRERRMAATARIAATQTMADNVLTMALAIVWPSAWAIVLPKLLTAPIWTIMARRARPFRPDRSVTGAPLTEFKAFGPAVLTSELLAALRVNADKLIVGGLLGTKALGVYYFAFNAGLGITQSFVSACTLVVFPHLAKANANERAREFRRAFWQGLLLLAPVVAAQALLAPIYVPIVFGSGWTVAAPYVALLSAAALPLYAGALMGALYRAEGRPFAETRLTAIAAFAGLGLLTVGAQFGLAAACAGFAAGLAVTLIPRALREVFAKSEQSHAFQGDH